MLRHCDVLPKQTSVIAASLQPLMSTRFCISRYYPHQIQQQQRTCVTSRHVLCSQCLRYHRAVIDSVIFEGANQQKAVKQWNIHTGALCRANVRKLNFYRCNRAQNVRPSSARCLIYYSRSCGYIRSAAPLLYRARTEFACSKGRQVQNTHPNRVDAATQTIDVHWS